MLYCSGMSERSVSNLGGTIRHMRFDDTQTILRIANLSKDSHWTASMIEEDLNLPTSLSLVVEIHQKIVGFGICRIVPGETQIIDLAIHPQYRRQGLGTQLLRSIRAKSKEKGSESLVLEVRSTNSPALKCYSKEGFVEVGTRKNFYPPILNQSTDARILKCEIN